MEFETIEKLREAKDVLEHYLFSIDTDSKRHGEIIDIIESLDILIAEDEEECGEMYDEYNEEE